MKPLKLKRAKFLMELHVSYRVSLAIWDHTALPAKVNPALTPARQASTQFIYPRGMEG